MQVVSFRARLGSLLSAVLLCAASAPLTVAAAAPRLLPAVSDYQLVKAGATPPTLSDCIAAGRRCFTPAGFHAAYDLGPLYDSGLDGSGITVAIVDSYGSDTMANDLHVFDQAFGLPAMCGEVDVTCTSGMPTFTTLSVQGSPATVAQPGKGTHQEDKSAWSIEVALDVESVHTFAPGANILLVTVPTAETLGVQGFPLMMAAEQYVVDHHLADVISQSFGASELTFGSTASLLNLRHAYQSAAANGVTVLASTGDFGSTNAIKQPVGQGGGVFATQNVAWPASDPLVTAVGGTYLCTDPLASTRVVDSSSPPARCAANPGQAEVGWIDTGGGFSSVFSKPAYQDTLPAGSTAIGSMRGIPDIASEASSLSGPLIYDSNAGLDTGSNVAGGNGGWYVIGGTSVSCPEWAGMVAIADQINGGGLGLINPGLYALASNTSQYAADFFDVTTGDNGAFAPDVPGYPATTGWDPVTGLGTPDAAALLPDLVTAVNSQ
ncbi:MAG TPA: S53 family peptidase [Candidatus Limnocylindrales bacterium]|nr:S53 family peptidase [Candidatus Limnocylindrales bacterium]